MAVGVRTPPEIRDVVDHALARIRARGFDFDAESEDELSEIVLQGYRLLQEERILDLDETHPERIEAERRAREGLNRFVDEWIDEQDEDGGRKMTIRTYVRARRKVCPVYPFR